ncbi:MAG: hypothetical protein HWD59_10930 [Coxiellaceae bacterium]|nr:MAG: hypothetical protein HWD59_10930 [Coxiellaceae bacterium]
MVEKLGITDRLVILRKPFDEIELRQLTLSLIEKSRLNHKLNRQSESLQRLIEERTHELQKQYYEESNARCEP